MIFFRRFRDIAACVVLLALPFFFLRATLRAPETLSPLDRVLLRASAPIQYLAAQLALSVNTLVQDYVYLINVKADNARLQHDNAHLRATIRRLRGAARENHRLRNLLQLREQVGHQALSAQVVGKEVSPFFRVTKVRLDRGESERIKVGMPAVTTSGLVGQVRRIQGRYSELLLTADRTSAVDVVVPRSGARGILRGTGNEENYICRLEHLSRTDDVKVGDEVVTSGMGQRFPADILVGRVSRIAEKEFGLYQEAEVTPSVNFSALHEVLILTEGSRQQLAQEH